MTTTTTTTRTPGEKPGTTRLSFPAYSGVTDDRANLAVLDAIVDRVEAIAATGCTVYGENYSRRVMDTLVDIHMASRSGVMTDHIERMLQACEVWAGLREDEWKRASGQ